MKQLVVILSLSLIMLLGSMREMSASDLFGGWILNRSGDYRAAIEAWTYLAESGDPEYESHLAKMYRRGVIEVHNPKAAIKWYSRAAKRGFLEAILPLGRMYERGEGVTQDYNAAAKWYKLAADKGYSPDLIRLSALKAGNRYSLRFWRLVARLGSVDAKVNLGTMYFIGEGVLQDYNRAFNWYTLAAEEGDVSAQKNLGKMYRYGLGTKKMPIISHMWYTLAAWQGDKAAATAKNLYESRMFFSQIEEVQKLARKCIRNNYVGC